MRPVCLVITQNVGVRNLLRQLPNKSESAEIWVITKISLDKNDAATIISVKFTLTGAAYPPFFSSAD